MYLKFILKSILFFSLLSAGAIHAIEIPKGSLVYVWDFRTSDDIEDSDLIKYLTQKLTQEFEEQLFQVGCFKLVDRRNRKLIQEHRELEKSIRGIEDLTADERRILKESKVLH